MDVLVPRQSPVDRTKAGTLHITPEILGAFLNLPDGQEVVSAEVDRSRGTLLLVVEGRGLPTRPEAGPPVRVHILCNKESRPGDVEQGGCEYRLTAWWSHDPGQTWVMRPWGPK